MGKRESGADVLRLVGLFLVVLFHSFLNNGYYSQPQTGLWMWLWGSIRWLSTGCIGIFLMLSGYLCCGRTGIRSCWRSLGPVLLGYALAAAVSIPVRHFLFGDTRSFSGWFTRFYSFQGVYYGWYVGMYVGLVALMPFLNRLLGQLDRRGLLCFSGVLLVLTALPGLTGAPVVPVFWRNLYPVSYYVLGAAIRRLRPAVPGWMGIAGALAVSLCMGAATVLSTDGSLSQAATWEFADLWVVFISLGLFLGLYRLRLPPPAAKIAAIGAGGCYGGYLLSHLLDGWAYRLLRQFHTPEGYPVVFVGVSLPIFLLSVTGGWLLERVTRRGKGVAAC